jgi:hypothetical protein
VLLGCVATVQPRQLIDSGQLRLLAFELDLLREEEEQRPEYRGGRSSGVRCGTA